MSHLSYTLDRFVIRNLPSSTKIENISICAVNQADLKGKRALVTWGEQVNHTQPCSRFYQIQQEIQRVLNHLGDFIDSDFYTVSSPLITLLHLTSRILLLFP